MWNNLPLILLQINFPFFIQAVRCRTEDGPSAEEVKKVIRTCMNKLSDEQKGSSNLHSKNDSDEDDDDSDEDSNEKQNNHHSNNKQLNRGGNNRNIKYQHESRFKRETKPNTMPMQPQDNNDFQSKHSQLNHSDHSISNGQENSCMVQCFFQEMKMVYWQIGLNLFI